MVEQPNKRYIKHPILVIAVTIISLGFVYLLQTKSELFSLYYVFQLFGTLVHEIGHSFAAILTGGKAHGFVVNASSGGYAMTSGGNYAVILPAGYVGCAVFGSLFFFLANRFRWADFFAFLIGLFIIIFTLKYGEPEENGKMTAHFLAVGFGSLLMFLGFKGPLWLNMIMVNVITTMTALQGVMGAWTIYVLSEDWHHNDAEMYSDAYATWMSGNTVALIWAIFSVCCFFVAFYFGVWRTIRHGGKWHWNYIG